MKKYFLSLLMAVSSVAAFADDGQALLAQLRSAYPGTHFDSVSQTMVNGLFEIRMGKNVAYTDAVGKVWIFGHLYDRTTGQDLTADRLRELENSEPDAPAASSVATATRPAAKPAEMNPEDAIVRVHGKGSRTLIVFSDVDCGYCRKLESELAKLDDVRILTFPVAMVGDGSRADGAWCAPDRAEAWSKAMLGQDLIRSGDCQSPVRRNTLAAIKASVRGTPTLFRADGGRIDGYATATRIDAWLGR